MSPPKPGIGGEQIAEEADPRDDREIDTYGLYMIPGAFDDHVPLDTPKPQACDPSTADMIARGSVGAPFSEVTTSDHCAHHFACESLAKKHEYRKSIGKRSRSSNSTLSQGEIFLNNVELFVEEVRRKLAERRHTS